MRYLIAAILIPLALLAQVQNIPNTTFPAVRSMMNGNFGWLNTNKAGISACPANQYAIQTTTAGVVCASLTSGQLTTALGFIPENAANKGQNGGYLGIASDGSVAIGATVLHGAGDGTDATARIQAALNGGGWVHLTGGSYLFSGVTMPKGSRLTCDPTATLTYTGSATAIKASTQAAWYQKFEVDGCTITKQGARAGVGIELASTVGARVSRNTITGFSKAISLDGTISANWSDEVWSNAIDTVDTGIYMAGAAVSGVVGGSNLHNIAWNTITGVYTQGIYSNGACAGMSVSFNNVENMLGDTVTAILWGAQFSRLEGNWIEGSAGTGKTWKGIDLAGDYNTVLPQKLGLTAAGGTVTQMVRNEVLYPHNIVLDATAGPFFFPGAIKALSPTSTNLTLQAGASQSSDPLLNFANVAGTFIGFRMTSDGNWVPATDATFDIGAFTSCPGAGSGTCHPRDIYIGRAAQMAAAAQIKWSGRVRIASTGYGTLTLTDGSDGDTVELDTKYLKLSGSSGTGQSFACFDANGKLVRSDTACR